MRQLADWLDRRTGFRDGLTAAGDEVLKGGSSIAYVFGRALMMLVALQALTGILLMATYVPAVHSAWSSVYYIQFQVTAGWFIRGMHHYGASAVMVVMSFHLLQVVIYGAYRQPREVNWWLGLVLMQLVMGLGLTGYLLPWDQKAYWASKVTTSVAGSVPLVGPWIKRLVIGGVEYGQLTLSRFYFLHVTLLPMLMGAVLVLHYVLFRRHGITSMSGPGKNPAHAEPYVERQVWLDLAVSFVVIGAVAAIAIVYRGAPLDAPADPTVDYPPRPEWYFRFLFQMFKLMPGELEIIATVVIPAVAGLYLFALPWLDRAPSNHLSSRWPWVAPVVLASLGVVALTAHSLYQDAHDPEYARVKRLADQRAARSIALASKGVPPEGPLAMLERDPVIGGGDLYRTHCAKCHVLNGQGKREAPDHDGFGSRAWILGMLHHPNSDAYFGKTKIDDMPSQTKLGEPTLRAITEFLYAQGQEPGDPPVNRNLLTEGRRLFESKCMRCHVFEGDGDFEGLGGPDLTGYASSLWLYRQTVDPQKHYGELNEMPAFAEDLTPEEVTNLVRFLRLQRYLPAAKVPQNAAAL